ncbi:katanin p60 ATPase-containing subunit A-like 1 isoform X1 [Diaphorina citri]|uniref:Katanin p60 ATPase-containing subunit A-like 1 isoform X1 n=2 Tax=Diaphorina citri TaxID=121845 RepID=A0A1S3D4S7_DIACI|nr:katanin p60 ATPase-containing subunit A-like 1 isoform X1 [Diaphorina citri]
MDTTKTNGATPKLAVVEKGKPRTGVPKVGPNRRANPELTALVEKDIVQTDTGVGWDDIAGLDNVKQIFKETLLLPKLMPQLFKGILRPWRGILLFGPPGTGKTLLAKAVASQHGSTFFNVLPSSLTSKHYGESEKLVRALFETARARAPAVIFIDEVDAFCSGSREHEATRRVRCELLSHMDGVGTGSGDKGVLVLAATNHPWDLDEALKRRFEKRIYIPLPDEHTRSQIIGLCLGEIRKDPNVDVATLSKQLIGYSGSDIRDLCQEIILIAAREVIQNAGFTGVNSKPPDGRNNIGAKGDDSKCQVAPLGSDRIVLNRSHFERAKEKCRKSVDGALIRKYKRWNELYGSR